MAFPATQSIWIHTLELALAASLSRMPTKLLEMKIYNVSLPGRIARLPWPALNKHHRRPEMRKVWSDESDSDKTWRWINYWWFVKTEIGLTKSLFVFRSKDVEGKFVKKKVRTDKLEDTHHGFYLLVPEVCHQSWPVVDESWSVSQQCVDGDLGGDPDIGEWQTSTRGLPLADVHQPLTGWSRLE